MLIQQQRAGFDLKDPFRSYVPVLWQTMIHSFQHMTVVGQDIQR